MTQRRMASTALAALLIVGAPGLAACSAAAGEQSASSPTATVSVPASAAASSVPSASVAASGDADVAVGPGAELPDSWPAELPSFDGGVLASVVVADDGANINAAWTADAPLAEAFTAMDAALKAKGFTTYKDSGAGDMYIETEDMLSDNYTSADFDVNLTVALNGGQTTVLLNASRL